MRKIKQATAILLLLAAAIGNANAQRKIKEGMVTYTASYELTADQQQYAGDLPKEITCYFRGDSSAAIVNQGLAVIKGVSVFKSSYHSMLIEIPSASKKIAVVMTPAEVEEEKVANPQLTSTKEKEKQLINGYNCFKIIITDTKSKAAYEMWVTNDIDMAPNSVTKPVSAFGGVPVKFVTFNHGIKINAELKEIKETPVPQGFFTATSDYEIMSFVDLKKLSSGN